MADGLLILGIRIGGRVIQRPYGEPHGSRTPSDASIPPVEEVVDLYVNHGLSTYGIGQKVGIDHQRVTRMLRRAGVVVSPRGKKRPRPLRGANHVPEQTLRHLYLEERMTSTAIGHLLGISDRLIREDLARYGIDRRHRGCFDRRDRADVDPEDLDELYVKKELPAGEVGLYVGVSGRIVLRSAHNHGVPVRVGGTPCPSNTDIPLLDALYGDPAVRRVLRRHHVPIVKTTGPIWQRFTTAAPLSRELLSDLYEKCGLSSFQIELVTGQPSIMILRRLAAVGIKRRPPGGLSPFLRQRRQKNQG
jgi:hypothetical protein